MRRLLYPVLLTPKHVFDLLEQDDSDGPKTCWISQSVSQSVGFHVPLLAMTPD